MKAGTQYDRQSKHTAHAPLNDELRILSPSGKKTDLLKYKNGKLVSYVVQDWTERS